MTLATWIIARLVFAIIALMIWCGGCATVGAVASHCRPSTTDEQQAVDAVLADTSITQAEAIAVLEGGKIAWCVVVEIAQGVVDKANTLAFSTPPTPMGAAFEEPPMVVRARAVLATKHPQ